MMMVWRKEEKEERTENGEWAMVINTSSGVL
jgi:hypothetical protein